MLSAATGCTLSLQLGSACAPPLSRHCSCRPPIISARSFNRDRIVTASAGTSSEQADNKVLHNAAAFAQLPADVFAAKLMELSNLLPGLSRERLLRLDPRLLGKLILDTPGVASRLITLHELFPTACIAALISRRPALLLQEEFAGVHKAKAALQELFPDSDLDLMVEDQPLLLVENVKDAIEELRRLMPYAGDIRVFVWT